MGNWRNRMREEGKKAKKTRSQSLWDRKSDDSKAAELGYPKTEINSWDSSARLRSDLYPPSDTLPSKGRKRQC